MRTTLVVVFALWSVVPARAATITWFDSGFLTFVSGSAFQFPGLTVGTPWSLEVNFDPSAPGSPAAIGTPGSNCNVYPMGSTTFTLGTFTYTSTGGQIWTNSDLPGLGCSPAPTGTIQFEWGVTWTQEPGAWNLNVTSGLLMAGYTDAVQSDGFLPTSPTLSGANSGLNFYDFFRGTRPQFQDHTFAPQLADLNPTPVPEPATLGLFGVGLAYLARRRVQRLRSK